MASADLHIWIHFDGPATRLDDIQQSLARIEQAQTTEGAKIMTALEDERAALVDLTDEVTAALDALAAQVQGGVSAADAEALAADIKAQAQRIRDALPPVPPAV